MIHVMQFYSASARFKSIQYSVLPKENLTVSEEG